MKLYTTTATTTEGEASIKTKDEAANTITTTTEDYTGISFIKTFGMVNDVSTQTSITEDDATVDNIVDLIRTPVILTVNILFLIMLFLIIFIAIMFAINITHRTVRERLYDCTDNNNNNSSDADNYNMEMYSRTL